MELFGAQSTVKTQDAKLMADVAGQCLRNPGGWREYGAQQTAVRLFPLNPDVKVLCPDGQRKTLAERLVSSPDVPTDDRAVEVASAVAFGATAVACELTNLLDVVDAEPAANAVLALMLSVTVVDNCYDALSVVARWAAAQLPSIGSRGSDAAAPIEGSAGRGTGWQWPAKGTLPLGLGSGRVTGAVVRGWTRLATVDAAREAQCESAALYAAYVLGLPCFAFSPNALEASVLVAESNIGGGGDGSSNSNNGNGVDNLLTASGLLRMLVWLMAGPAMESMTHPQLIVSDPKEAEGFLQRLEEYYGKNSEAPDLFWVDDTATTKEDLLKWAYAEADVLLRSNKAVVKELSNRLTSGAATIGDCVAVIEGW